MPQQNSTMPLPGQPLAEALPGSGLSLPAAADDRFVPSTFRLLLLFAILAAAAPLLGLAIIKWYGPQVEREAYANLEAIARLKAQQIENWLGERDSDGRALLIDKDFTARIARLQQAGATAQGKQMRQEIGDRLDAFRLAYGYDTVLLLDAQGHIWLQHGRPHMPQESNRALVAQAFLSGKVQRSPLYIDQDDAVPALDFVVPLSLDTRKRRQPVAAVLFHIEATRFLFPLIQNWPTASPSAETLLVRRDGESVVFLNELRHRKDTAMKLKLPLGQPGLPAATAVREAKPGTMPGIDHRGVAVLAAYRPVAGTRWHIVAKIDRAEVLAPLWELVFWIALVVFSAIAAISAALWLFLRQQKRLVQLHAQVAAVAALEESERRFRAVTETAGDAIVSADATGTIVSWNPATERLFGYTAAELGGQALTLLMPPRFSHGHDAGMQRRLADGAAPLGGKAVELMGMRKDGTEFSIELSVARWQTQHGQFFTGIMRDISARKEVEQQLREHRQHLEETVQSRTADLCAALETAQLADMTKDAFLANVSHELRTPLSAVIGLSDLARKLAMDPKQRDYLDKISSSGKHLARIINDLLDLSKIAAGRMELELAPFKLRELIARVTSVMSYRAAEKGLTLVDRIAATVPEVLLGDSLRIEQVLINLLSNAVKFSSSGQIEVRVGLHQRSEKRICLEVEVEDFGIGLSNDDIERLFQPFSQADVSISRKFGGTGLGLAICKRLVEMMEGEIGVSSRVGVGSTFRVRVWLELGDAAELEAARRKAQGSALPMRYRNSYVLVVDDQPLNREIVEELLQAVGIVPRSVAHGQAALDLLRACGPKAFDLVLMDIQMPVMDGLAATRELRRWAEFKDLPVVVMTAHIMEHERQTSIEAGANDHIGKPFETARFYRMLAKWISKAKHQQSAAAAKAGPEAGGCEGASPRRAE